MKHFLPDKRIPILEHPSHSPDPAPCGFYLLSKFSSAIRDHIFNLERGIHRINYIFHRSRYLNTKLIALNCFRSTYIWSLTRLFVENSRFSVFRRFTDTHKSILLIFETCWITTRLEAEKQFLLNKISIKDWVRLTRNSIDLSEEKSLRLFRDPSLSFTSAFKLIRSPYTVCFNGSLTWKSYEDDSLL